MVFKLFNKRVNPTHIVPDDAANDTSHKNETPKESFHEEEQAVETSQDSIQLGDVTNDKVKLGIEKQLFSRTGESVPIILTGLETFSPFHSNLQIRGRVFEGNDVVLEDSATKALVAVVERNYATAGNIFKIYSPHPVYHNQKPSDVFKYGQQVYDYAQVKKCGRVLTVVMVGESDPTYTIHKVVQHPSWIFPTKHVIKKNGEAIATTRYVVVGEANSYTLSVEAGADPCLTICLAAIADEVDK